jgi:hypothetical protein
MTLRETRDTAWLEQTIARIPPELGDAPTEGVYPAGIDYDLERDRGLDARVEELRRRDDGG